MTEATQSVPWAQCEGVVRALTFHPPGWASLHEIVLLAISLLDRKRDRGLAVINQCLRNGQLILEWHAPDGTTTVFLRTDWEQQTVCAALDPAEAVWLEPYIEGYGIVWTPTARAEVELALARTPPPEPPPNASVVDKIVWAYLCLRSEAPDQLQLPGDALRNAVYRRITPGFTASPRSWTRAMAKVHELDRRAASGEQN